MLQPIEMLFIVAPNDLNFPRAIFFRDGWGRSVFPIFGDSELNTPWSLRRLPIRTKENQSEGRPTYGSVTVNAVPFFHPRLPLEAS